MNPEVCFGTVVAVPLREAPGPVSLVRGPRFMEGDDYKCRRYFMRRPHRTDRLHPWPQEEDGTHTHSRSPNLSVSEGGSERACGFWCALGGCNGGLLPPRFLGLRSVVAIPVASCACSAHASMFVAAFGVLFGQMPTIAFTQGIKDLDDFSAEATRHRKEEIHTIGLLLNDCYTSVR